LTSQVQAREVVKKQQGMQKELDAAAKNNKELQKTLEAEREERKREREVSPSHAILAFPWFLTTTVGPGKRDRESSRGKPMSRNSGVPLVSHYHSRPWKNR
jgi:hypothetical protein